MTYGTTVVDATAQSVVPAIDAGYRWVWNSGIALRLGMTMQDTPKYKYTATTEGESADQSDKAIAAARTSNNDGLWLAGLDLGLGWMF
jgi:hypothetical protein